MMPSSVNSFQDPLNIATTSTVVDHDTSDDGDGSNKRRSVGNGHQYEIVDGGEYGTNGLAKRPRYQQVATKATVTEDDEDMPDIASMLSGSFFSIPGEQYGRDGSTIEETPITTTNTATNTSYNPNDISPRATFASELSQPSTGNISAYLSQSSQQQQQQQQRQYTWIMETGQNESRARYNSHHAYHQSYHRNHHGQQSQQYPYHRGGSPSNSTAAAAAAATALYHSLLGANTLPLHFQQLLAASSLLYNNSSGGISGGENDLPMTASSTVKPYHQNHHPHQHHQAPNPTGHPSHYAPPFFPVILNPFLAGAAAAAAAAHAPNANSGKKCTNCGTTSTPSWRRCLAGKDLLCNACGLYQKLHKRPRPFRVAEDGSIRVQRNNTHQDNTAPSSEGVEEPPLSVPMPLLSSGSERKLCHNCQTTDTPLWRKVEGQLYCNACALFYKTHGTHRAFPSTLESPEESNKRRRHHHDGMSNPMMNFLLEDHAHHPGNHNHITINTDNHHDGGGGGDRAWDLVQRRKPDNFTL